MNGQQYSKWGTEEEQWVDYSYYSFDEGKKHIYFIEHCSLILFI